MLIVLLIAIICLALFMSVHLAPVQLGRFGVLSIGFLADGRSGLDLYIISI